MTTERLFRLLDTVQSHIRIFDTKAQIVMAGAGLLATAYSVMAPRYEKALIDQSPSTPLSILTLLLGAAGLAAFVFCLVNAFLTLNPRTKLKQPDSLLFFVHLSRQYGTDYLRCFKDISHVTEELLRRDLTNQILVNSNICNKKCSHARGALQFLFAGFACWVVLFILTFLGIA
jgi:hypothetical protein